LAKYPFPSEKSRCFSKKTDFYSGEWRIGDKFDKKRVKELAFSGNGLN
jgi:hypothetical protein